MLKNKKRLSYSLATALAIVLMGQACGDSFQAKVGSLNSSSYGDGNPYACSPKSSPATVPQLLSWNSSYPSPVKAADCLTNSSYNLCLTYKDPVSTYGARFSPAFTPSSATAAQESQVFVYGVRVPASGSLSNDHFLLSNGGYQTVAPTSAGDWKHSYRSDSNHYVAQLHAWYWLNWYRSYMIERTQTFFASANLAGKKMVVRPAANVENNAYFDSYDYSMSLGWSNINQNGQKADLALDVATAIHELGHGNFYIANKSSIDGDYTSVECFQGQTYCCSSVRGCPGAIHEGVADFHAAFAFPDKKASILDYFFNTFGGEQWRNLDWIETNGITAQRLYDRNGQGQIHDLGTVYASIWYGVWKKAKNSCAEADIEKLFVEHLAGLGGSDTFITAYSTISALANQIFPAKADKIRADFKMEYARMGLTVP